MYLVWRMLMTLRIERTTRSSVRTNNGQTLVEYALILVLIAVLLVAALVVFRETLSQTFSTIVAAWPAG